MREKTNIQAAIQHLQIAKNLLEAESTIEQHKGKGKTNWGRVGTLTDFAKNVQQILNSDHGECGLEVYNERFEKNRMGGR